MVIAGTSVLLLVGVFVAQVSSADAQVYSQINSSTTLRMGSRSEGVRAMQAFLASNGDMYPTGMVTGYFGPLTHSAVVQFQLSYGLTPDGIAGPRTQAKMNELIASGRGLDVYAPAIANPSISVSGRNATVSLNSSEPVSATLYYSTSPLIISESAVAFGAPTVSGITSVDATMGTNKTFSLTNLDANANYHYSVMVKDASGNISLAWPTTTFTTGQ